MINIEWELNHSRIEVLQHLVDSKKYKTYLEIGCDKNQVFDKIVVANKEGVDPNRGGTVRKTSDDFFTNDNRKWDLIFIDGLHAYEQVARDVENAISRLNDNGTIIIHDMLPARESQATLVPTEKYWLGDVWRLAFDLIERSDIKFNIFTFDFGCGIITKDPQVPIVVVDKNETWEFYKNNYTKLPLITFNEYFLKS
jgi:predicted O-methyltransferase YrrM